MEKGVLDEEREKIRELHQRQQDSLKSLQALENRFCHIAINDEETLRGSSVASRVPTLELMTSAPVMELPPLEKPSKPQKDFITIDLSTADDSDTSDSDATMSGDDNEEQISTEELAKAADHVKKLLKRITMLQKAFETNKKKHRKRHVHKMYQRFCRKFESGIKLPSAADFGKVAPFIDFHMNDNSGSLENFDCDNLLQVPGESTHFPLDDFYFNQGQRSVPQQTTDLDAISSTQSSQHPPLVSYESAKPIPLSTAYTLDYPPMPAVDAAPGSSFDPSAQRPERSLDQGRSLLARGSPDLLVQTRAQTQMQSQVTPQPQAQTQYSPLQSPQVTPHDARFQIPEIGQTLPSPAIRSLRSTRLRPVSTPSSDMPPPSELMIPPPDRPLSPGFNRWLEKVSTPSNAMPPLSEPMIPETSRSLSPSHPDLRPERRPPIRNTALQNHQDNLMFLDCRKRKAIPVSEQDQNGNSQSITDTSTTESVPSQPEGSARQDTHALLCVVGRYAGSGKVHKAKMGKRRKRALTAEQKNNAVTMRLVEACHNCQSLDLKVKYITSISRVVLIDRSAIMTIRVATA